MIIWVILGLVALLVIGGVLIFNKLVSLRQMARNGWSDIDVQLKRRADLIPRLVDTVKGYAAHERGLFEDVTKARQRAQAAGDDVTARGAAEASVSRETSRLFALKEDYPDLKANENFLDLQNELSETEDKIEFARRFYNGAVREMNIAVKTIPYNFVAGPFGFREWAYFEADESAINAPDVDFN